MSEAADFGHAKVPVLRDTVLQTVRTKDISRLDHNSQRSFQVGLTVWPNFRGRQYIGMYWARNKRLQNVISTTQAGLGRLV